MSKGNVVNSNIKNVQETSLFVQQLEELKEEINDYIDFLNIVEENPECFFIHAKDKIIDHRSFLFNILEYKSRKTKVGSIYDFQLYLAEKMNEVFQTWKEQNGINVNLVIKARNPRTFPTIYAVYEGDEERIQFNPFQKYYGSRFQMLSEGELIRLSQNKEIDLKKEKKRELDRLNNLRAYQKNPYAHISSLKDAKYVFFHKKQTMKYLDESIEQKESDINYIEKQIEENREELVASIKKHDEHKRIFKLIEPFFLKYDYTLETNRYKLY